MSLVTTPGDPSANAYCDIAYVDAYIAGRVGSQAWSGATVADQEAAIRYATSNLDLMYWHGWKTVPEGALRFPRSGLYDMDAIALTTSTIPKFLEDAAAEYAFIFVRDGDITAQPDSAGLKKLKAGSAELEFDTTPGSSAQSAKPVPETVMRMVRHYLRSEPGDVRAYRA